MKTKSQEQKVLKLKENIKKMGAKKVAKIITILLAGDTLSTKTSI